MYFLQGNNRIPYIESDGNSYIETEYPGFGELCMRVLFSFSPKIPSDSVERQYIFGTYSQGASGVINRYQFMYGGSGFTASGTRYTGLCGFGNGGLGIGWGGFDAVLAGYSGLMSIYVKNGVFRFKAGGQEDVLYTPPSIVSFSDSSDKILLFACNENGVAGHFSKGVRIHRVEFYEDVGSGQIDPISMLVPHVKNGQIGMYDPFGSAGNFSENKGSGTFQIGV